MPIPALCLLGLLAWRTLPSDPAADGVPPALPWRRLLLLAGGVLAVAYSGRVDGLAGRVGLVLLALGLVALFLYRDGRSGNRLLPTNPLSITHPVGTAYWLIFLLSLAYSPIGVFMPLLGQQLQGLTPFSAGYLQATMALGWSLMAVVIAGLTLGWQRVVVVVGPLVVAIGVIGQAQSFDTGPLALLVVSIFLTGAGVGLCHAHVANWAMTLTRPEEGSLTAGAIPTIQSLGIAFGAAIGGMIANAAGLEAGLDPATVAEAAHWIYGFCFVPPLAAMVFGLQLRALRGRHSV